MDLGAPKDILAIWGMDLGASKDILAIWGMDLGAPKDILHGAWIPQQKRQFWGHFPVHCKVWGISGM